MTHTKDRLAVDLRAAGLHTMADKAADGLYHDFLSPLALPSMQLLTDLDDALAKHECDAKLVTVIRGRHLVGEYDADDEESEAWAESTDGQKAFTSLVDNTYGLQEAGRLAMRVEGNWWCAYWARPDTMKDAVPLGTIAMDIVKNKAHKEAFMSIMRSYLSELIEKKTGVKPAAFHTKPAPKSERS
jgi:hypothetical protein